MGKRLFVRRNFTTPAIDNTVGNTLRGNLRRDRWRHPEI